MRQKPPPLAAPSSDPLPLVGPAADLRAAELPDEEHRLSPWDGQSGITEVVDLDAAPFAASDFDTLLIRAPRAAARPSAPEQGPVVVAVANPAAPQRTGPLEALLEGVNSMNFHHRAGSLLSRVDGELSYEDLVAISGMPRLETLRILVDLVHNGVIG
jgi:hypothetical protein